MSDSDKAIPKVWTDLMFAIAEREGLRETMPRAVPGAPPVPPYEFHGFEVTASRLGGMGMVLLGRDPELKRRVAIKLLQRSGPDANADLMVEAQTLAKLDHANVVRVYSVSKWEGGLFFVMEFVDGKDGKKWLKSRPGLQEILHVFIDAGKGLAAAHDEGIQHGDFKPENMLIGNDGRTRVVDFGIADYLRVEDDGEPRSGRRRAGTPEYMAPERLRGHRGDARSDQFSFCVALWRALYGARPFPGKTVAALLDAIMGGAWRPEEAPTPVPDWLTRVVSKGLAENPDHRYANMHELVRDLEGGASSDESSAEEGAGDEEEYWIGHEGRVLHAPAWRRWGYVAAAALSVLAVLGVSMLTRSTGPEPEAYTMILGLAAADRLTDAQQTWSDRAAELSDEQSLQIAREWVSRARVQAREDRVKARELAAAAREVAVHVERHAEGAEARQAGGRVSAEAEIFALIAADEFEEAQRRWLEHEAELTDEQALWLAEDCLGRAEQLADVAHAKACAAAVTAHEIAGRTAVSGMTNELKKKGSRLAAEASAFSVDHPDVCPD